KIPEIGGNQSPKRASWLYNGSGGCAVGGQRALTWHPREMGYDNRSQRNALNFTAVEARTSWHPFSSHAHYPPADQLLSSIFRLDYPLIVKGDAKHPSDRTRTWRRGGPWSAASRTQEPRSIGHACRE